MADILHQFSIKAAAKEVYRAVSTPAGLDAWWTMRSSGEPVEGTEWELWFAPEYVWRATVTRSVPAKEFELTLTSAMEDWIGTHVGFELTESENLTSVRFYHAGWAEESAHFCGSSYCWAMYLRLLKRYLELGEVVKYEERDQA